MQDSYSSNPLVQRIHILLHTLSSSSITVSFLWIPGLINLPDHDIVDTAAKASLQLPKISDSLASAPAYDLNIYYRSLIQTSWHNLWTHQTSNKLRQIKKSPFLRPPQTERPDTKKPYSAALE